MELPTRLRPNYAFLALVFLVLAAIAITIYEQSSAGHRKSILTSKLESLNFSHGLKLGLALTNKDSLQDFLEDRGYIFHTQLGPNTFEFKNLAGSMLLRVKANPVDGITAIYFYLLAGGKKSTSKADEKDILGLSKQQVLEFLGKPTRRELLKKSGKKEQILPPKGPPVSESWFYLGQNLELTITFDQQEKAVEVVLQRPISE